MNRFAGMHAPIPLGISVFSTSLLTVALVVVFKTGFGRLFWQSAEILTVFGAFLFKSLPTSFYLAIRKQTYTQTLPTTESKIALHPDGSTSLGFWAGSSRDNGGSDAKGRRLVDLVGPCSNITALDATEFSWNPAVPVTDLPAHALASFMPDHDSSLVGSRDSL